MRLRQHILKVLYNSSVALTIREICYHVFNNGYPCEYVVCRFWRNCKYNQVARVVRDLYKTGLVKVFRAKIRNVKSPWNYTYCTLVYIKEEQLRQRLKLEKRCKPILLYLSQTTT